MHNKYLFNKSHGLVLPLIAVAVVLGLGALGATLMHTSNTKSTNVKSSTSQRLATNTTIASATDCSQYNDNKNACNSANGCDWESSGTCSNFSVANCPGECDIQTSAGACMNGGLCAGQNQATCNAYGQACSAKNAQNCESTPGCNLSGGCSGGTQCNATTASACTGKGYCTGASACSQYGTSSSCNSAPSGYNCNWTSYNCSWNTPSCTGTSPGCSWSSGYDYCAGNKEFGTCSPDGSGEEDPDDRPVAPSEGCKAWANKCANGYDLPDYMYDTCSINGTVGGVCLRVVVQNQYTCAPRNQISGYLPNTTYTRYICRGGIFAERTEWCTNPSSPMFCLDDDSYYGSPYTCGTATSGKVCPVGYKATADTCNNGKVRCVNTVPLPGANDTEPNSDADGDGLRNWHDPDSRACTWLCLKRVPVIWQLAP